MLVQMIDCVSRGLLSAVTDRLCCTQQMPSIGMKAPSC